MTYLSTGLFRQQNKLPFDINGFRVRRFFHTLSNFLAIFAGINSEDMDVVIREVNTPADRKQFVNLPFELYRGNTCWVPPMKADEIKSIDPEGNPAYGFCEANFWLAYLDNRCVGRIGAIINSKHNEKTGKPAGRISRPEFIDDVAVSLALFETAESWLREKGMLLAEGPLGFTNLDTQGLLIEGFDHLQSVASVYHLPYYKDHFDRLGYAKEIDWVEFRLTIEEIPEKAGRLAEMIQKRYQLKVLSFTKKKDLKPHAPRVFKLLNHAFEELFSVVAFDDVMIDYYSSKYFNFLNPEFVKLIETKDGELAGFIIGVPSLSKALQKAGGNMFPFGFLHLLRALKHPAEMDIFLTGVDPKLQGMGIPALLINELQKTILAHNIRFVETTGIFENNQKAIQHWKNYKHIQHKRRRCYTKAL
jgi:GNAT superfamily N-acetyltransferase